MSRSWNTAKLVCRGESLWECGEKLPSNQARTCSAQMPGSDRGESVPFDELVMSGVASDQDGAGRNPRGAVHVGESDGGVGGNLPAGRTALNLADHLVDLSQPGGADRLSVGQTPTVGVDGKLSGDLGMSGSEHGVLLTIGAEPDLGQMDQFGSAVSVLHLRQLHVGRNDAGTVEGRGGRASGRAASPSRREPR